MCTLLLEYGADVGAATKNVITPLHWAAGEGEIDATEMMIIEGVQTKGKDFVNIRDGEGRTPLHWALKVCCDQYRYYFILIIRRRHKRQTNSTYIETVAIT